MSVAKNPSVEKYSFFHTGAECAETYGVTAPGSAVIRTFDEPNVPYTGAQEADALVEFL